MAHPEYIRALEVAATLCDEWRDENKTAASSARKHGDHASMGDRLDGAAIECGALAVELRKMAVDAREQS